MRTVAIIQARMGSTRLPGKVLVEVCGKPLLAHLIERLQRCQTLDAFVIAQPKEEVLMNFVDTLPRSIGGFAGSEEDVLSRVLGAAKAYHAELIVELTADCPLIDPQVVDHVVRAYHEENKRNPTYGIDFASNVHEAAPMGMLPHAYPRGMDVRVFPLKTLERLDEVAKDPADREHVSLYAWEHPKEFSCLWVPAPEELRGYHGVRLTVDTSEDLESVRSIYNSLYPDNKAFDLAAILRLLKDNPWIRQLNSEVQQKPVR